MTDRLIMGMLDRTIPQGGATFPDDSALETLYQMVSIPAEPMLWLKARGISDEKRSTESACSNKGSKGKAGKE